MLIFLCDYVLSLLSIINSEIAIYGGSSLAITPYSVTNYVKFYADKFLGAILFEP